MAPPRPIIPTDVLLIVAINVIVAVVAYYLIVLWGLMEAEPAAHGDLGAGHFLEL